MAFRFTMEKVKRVRNHMGLSRSAFARKIGVYPQDIVRWEEGKNSPGPESMERIINALGMKPTVFWEEVTLGEDQGGAPAQI